MTLPSIPSDTNSVTAEAPSPRSAIRRFGIPVALIGYMVVKRLLPPHLRAILACLAIAVLLVRLLSATFPLGHLSSNGLIKRAAGCALLILVAMPGAWRDAVQHAPLLLFAFTTPLLLHIVVGAQCGASGWRATAGDFRARLEAFLKCLLPEKLASFAATDINLLSYAVPFLRRVDIPNGCIPITYHRQMRPIILVFVSLAFLEASVAHLLLMNARPAVRWVIFAIDDIGILYLLALAGSLSKLPILVSRDGVLFRAGIFMQMYAPREHISAVKSDISGSDVRQKGTLKMSLMSFPNMLVTLSEPGIVTLPLKGAKSIERVALHPDEPAVLLSALRGFLPEPAAAR